MSKRKIARRRTLMTFFLIGTILVQMIPGAGIGKAMQIAAEGNSRAAVSLEDYIVGKLKEGARSINVSAYKIPVSEVRAYDDVLNNHQELFYVTASYTFRSAGSFVQYYYPAYRVRIDEENGVTKDEMAKRCAYLEAAANMAAACVEPDMKPYEKVLAVHDYLILHCKYDYANYQAGTIPALSYTAYGALINGEAVCEGYSLAFRYIMTKLGIPCMVARSDKMNHAWNMVQLDGKWYHVDVTWDDPVWDGLGLVSHRNFLLSDSKISQPGPGSKGHSGWAVMDGTDTVDIVADSNTYDDAFWANIRSAICFYNGGWYYSKYQMDGYDRNTAIKLVRRERLLDGAEQVVDTAPAWNGVSSSYMCLAKSGENLYYNTPTEIRRLGKDGSISALDLRGDLGEKKLFGFTVLYDLFLCVPYESYQWGKEQKDSDIQMVTATDEDYKKVENNQVGNSGNQNNQNNQGTLDNWDNWWDNWDTSDDSDKPGTTNLKKGNMLFKGDLKFVVLDPAKKTVSVEGVAWAKGKKFAVNIPSTVVINGVQCKVTEVKKKGFANFAKITKVTFGKNITKVGKSAFDGCKKLKTIAFKGTKVPAFKGKAFKGTASKVKVKFAKKMSPKDKKKMKKKLKKAGIKKVR